MRRYLFAATMILISILLLVPALFFMAWWVRSAWCTDDIFYGNQSVTFQRSGMSRFKSQGGGIWLEFRPDMVTDENTTWQVFESNGQYSFAASPDDDLLTRFGFLGSANGEIWVFPCWFPLLSCLGLSILLFVAAYRLTVS